MCTRMESKIACDSVCNGRLIASSSTVSAGYFERLIGWSILTGRVVWVEPSASSSCLENMKLFHCAHHLGELPRSPS